MMLVSNSEKLQLLQDEGNRQLLNFILLLSFIKITYGTDDEILSRDGYFSKGELENADYIIYRIFHSNATPGDGINQACCIFLKDREITICFRGTQNRNDVWNDLQVHSIELPFLQNSGFVHVGFYNAFESLREKIVFRFNEAMEFVIHKEKNRGQNITRKDIHVVIAGHSLGGALAQITALYLYKKHNIHNLQVRTFGSPRLFDHRLAECYDECLRECTLNFVNNEDIVPYLTLPLSHVGFQNYISTGITVDVSCSNSSLVGFVTSRGHRVNIYLWCVLESLKYGYVEIRLPCGETWISVECTQQLKALPPSSGANVESIEYEEAVQEDDIILDSWEHIDPNDIQEQELSPEGSARQEKQDALNICNNNDQSSIALNGAIDGNKKEDYALIDRTTSLICNKGTPNIQLVICSAESNENSAFMDIDVKEGECSSRQECGDHDKKLIGSSQPIVSAGIVIEDNRVDAITECSETNESVSIDVNIGKVCNEHEHLEVSINTSVNAKDTFSIKNKELTSNNQFEDSDKVITHNQEDAIKCAGSIVSSKEVNNLRPDLSDAAGDENDTNQKQAQPAVSEGCENNAQAGTVSIRDVRNTTTLEQYVLNTAQQYAFNVTDPNALMLYTSGEHNSMVFLFTDLAISNVGSSVSRQYMNSITLIVPATVPIISDAAFPVLSQCMLSTTWSTEPNALVSYMSGSAMINSVIVRGCIAIGGCNRHVYLRFASNANVKAIDAATVVDRTGAAGDGNDTNQKQEQPAASAGCRNNVQGETAAIEDTGDTTTYQPPVGESGSKGEQEQPAESGGDRKDMQEETAPISSNKDGKDNEPKQKAPVKPKEQEELEEQNPLKKSHIVSRKFNWAIYTASTAVFCAVGAAGFGCYSATYVPNAEILLPVLDFSVQQSCPAFIIAGACTVAAVVLVAWWYYSTTEDKVRPMDGSGTLTTMHVTEAQPVIDNNRQGERSL